MFVKRAKFRVHFVHLDNAYCSRIAESILFETMDLLTVHDYMIT